MKTSELTGALLDVWVAKIELAFIVGLPINDETMQRVHDKVGKLPYSSSTNWAQGGPIIEREGIGVAKRWAPADGPITPGSEFTAISLDDTVWRNGPTPLIAAMRCYVASKYGDEVPE